MDYILEGTGEFRALSPQKRNCLYPDEKELKHFPLYSEPNCVLECSWSYAVRTCACAPWFLHSHYPGVHTCEAHGNQCFSDIVNNRYKLMEEECIKGCLPDCETVNYKISLIQWEYSL